MHFKLLEIDLAYHASVLWHKNVDALVATALAVVRAAAFFGFEAHRAADGLSERAHVGIRQHRVLHRAMAVGVAVCGVFCFLGTVHVGGYRNQRRINGLAVLRLLADVVAQPKAVVALG